MGSIFRNIIVLLSIATALLSEPYSAIAATKSTAGPSSIIVRSEKTETTDKISFHWDIRSRAAAFIRGRKLLVVFDKFNRDFSFPSVDSSELNYTTSIEHAKVDAYASIISIDLSEENLYATMERDANTWHCTISKTEYEKQDDMRVISKPLSAPWPHILIRTNESEASVIRFVDPDIGDKLAVIPISDSHTSTMREYKFVDFNIFKSSQGAAMQLISDSMNFNSHKGEIQINASSGLNISPKVFKKQKDSPDKIKQSSGTMSAEDSLLPFEEFSTFASIDLVMQVRIMREVIRSYNNKDDRAEAMLQLVYLYLTNSMFREAIAMFDEIATFNKRKTQTTKFKIAIGIAHFMNKDFTKAYDTLKVLHAHDVGIQTRKELRMYRTISEYMAYSSNIHEDRNNYAKMYLNRADNFFSAYPDVYLLETGLTILHRRIFFRKDYITANTLVKKIREDIKQSNLPDRLKHRYENRLLYMMGEIKLKTNKFVDAMNDWDKCIQKVDDIFGSTRCRLEKANIMYKTSRMTVKEYVEELERLSLLWRGDILEIEVTDKLGDGYVKAAQNIKALRAWNKIKEIYPNTSNALFISGKMSKIFIETFLNKEKPLDPFQSLSVFYEFKDLIPIGDVGDEIIIELAMQMVKLDLNEKAISLLNHQVRKRLEGIRKEKIINILAKLYLKIDKPSFAIDIISIGDEYIELPDDLAHDRRMLEAEAYYNNKIPEQALEILTDDVSQDADNIRAKIAWDERNWETMKDNAEPLMYQLVGQEDMLTEEQAMHIVRLYIAYNMLGNYKLMHYIDDKFSKRMTENAAGLLKIMQLTTKMNAERTPAKKQKIEEIIALLDGFIKK